MSSGKPTPPRFTVWFKASAYREFAELDGSVKPKVAAQLLRIQDNPLVGEPLGNRWGLDLSGYRKIYVDRKQIRIVWEVQLDRVVVVVMGIGPRDKGEIYRLVSRRAGELILTISGHPRETRPENP